MRQFIIPDGTTIDLDKVETVGAAFVNKNYPQYNCYEVYMTSGASHNIFESQLSRTSFLTTWAGP